MRPKHPSISNAYKLSSKPSTTMQTSTKPPKSILKKKLSSSQSSPNNGGGGGDERTPEQIKADRNLETALYHANIIQHRKDTELDILFAIETLLDFPTTTPISPAHAPSPYDIAQFKKLIRPFQPSDYDSLIEERNICRKCGYALCGNANLRDDKKGGFRIMGNGRGVKNEFKVLTKAEVERWCSEECARRALYVKVQLSETPAWERIGVQSDIELRGEPELPKSTLDGIAEELRKLDLGSERVEGAQDVTERRNAADLALERGEGGAASVKGLVDIRILEKDVARAQTAPTMDGMDTLDGELENLHLHLEGHISQFKQDGRRSQQEDDDMDMT